MNWDRTGQQVVGTYLETFNITGTVISSRVKYGGRVQHKVELDEPINVFGRIANSVLLDETEVAIKTNS